MSITDFREPFSRRNKPRASGPYIYDSVPSNLRHQLLYLLDDCTGNYYPATYSTASFGFKIWEVLRKQMRELQGRPTAMPYEPKTECRESLLNDTDEDALNFIDLAFRVIVLIIGKLDARARANNEITLSATEAVEKLNWRLGQHHLGYKFVGEELIRVDTEYTHQEITEPAFGLLNTNGFDAAREEFHRAHAAYLRGNNREALREAQNALDSCLKLICTHRRWSFEKRDGASKLIEIVLANGLVPNQVREQLSTLSSSLRSIGTIRNNTPGAGHGGGPDNSDVDPVLAAYVLHLTGAAIVFLIGFHNAQQ